MWLVAYVLWIPRLWISFYGTMFLWNTFTYELPFYGTMFLWNYVYEWQNKFLKQVFKVSYQSSDLREVMFRLKGTYDGKYETVGDIRRSLPLIPLCLRALVRHRAHMNKFDKFSKNDFYEIFLWMCVMWFCLSYECVYFIQTLLYLLSESSRCMFVLQATRVSSL